MKAQARNYNQKSDSMELIISLLFQYPQVNKINIDLNLKEVVFTFLIQRELAIAELKEFRLKLNQSLRLYESISQADVSEIETAFKYCGDLTELEISSGLANLSEEMISFFIRFICNEFETDLVREDIAGITDDISVTEDDFIDSLLENLKANDLNQILVGFRDEDRVLLFTETND